MMFDSSSPMKTSNKGRQGLRWIALGTIGVTTVLAVVGLLSRVVPPSPGSPDTSEKVHQSPDPKAVQADDNLADQVLGAVSLIDSYTKSRSGGTYRVYAIVAKSARFDPVGFQLVDTATGTRLHSGSLALEEKLSCLRVDLKDAEGNILLDSSDPYTSARLGESISYGSEAMSLTTPGIDNFANGSEKRVSLFVRSDGGVFFVEGLEIQGQCTWIRD